MPVILAPYRRQRQKDCDFKTSLGKVSETLSQKTNSKQKGWGHGSSGRALELETLGLIPST
jgi:hypothetical protein